MILNWNMELRLDEVRQQLPDPFDLPAKLDNFFTSSTVQEIINGGANSIRKLLDFLEECKTPSLARVAVILLSHFEPAEFYQVVLAILKKADRTMSEAFEPGLWLIRLPEKQIAEDLVDAVASSGNPNSLLLLQRPVAKEVRSRLAEFIAKREFPLSLYSLYSYGYALEEDDIPFMRIVSQWVGFPELSSLGGLYLLKLGSRDGDAGIQAGLEAPDVQLRTLTYYEFSRYLPREVVDRAKFDPTKPVDSQRSGVKTLMGFLAQG